MSKLRILIFVFAIICLLAIPIIVSAEEAHTTFYCSATKTSGGSGTQADPWACSTVSQFNAVISQICNKGGTNYLVELYPNGWLKYQIVASNGSCSYIYIEKGGYVPPVTGVNLPAPLLIGMVVGVGVLMVGGGMALRKKRLA